MPHASSLTFGNKTLLHFSLLQNVKKKVPFHGAVIRTCECLVQCVVNIRCSISGGGGGDCC